MTEDGYTARQLTEGRQAGKWAVFLGDKQTTKGGGEKSAKSWAKFMNRMNPPAALSGASRISQGGE